MAGRKPSINLQSEEHELDLTLQPVSPMTAEHESLLPSIATLMGTDRSSTAGSSASTSHHEGTKSLATSKGSGPVPLVSWGVDWRKPFFICAALFCGLALALGHHLYYSSLNGTVAGDEERQAWTIRFGTAFAFLVTSCFHASTAISFGQYVWTIVKRTPLTIGGLDILYSLTTDPTGIISFELLRSAKIALFCALTFWCIGFAGITPPATLTVVSRNITYTVPVPVLNFSRPAWQVETTVNRVALQAAVGFDVVPLEAPTPSLDWSYDLDFYGPTVQCAIANSTDQPIFDQISGSFETQDGIFIYSGYNDGLWNKSMEHSALVQSVYDPPFRLLYSAWSGYMGPIGDDASSANQWPNCPNIGPCVFPSCLDELLCPVLYIQTSTSSITCKMSNASFSVTIASINGLQQTTQRKIEPAPYAAPHKGVDIPYDEYVYYPHFAALSRLLIGNLSMSPVVDVSSDQNVNENNSTWALHAANTDLVSTGLLACAEIQQSPFVNLPPFRVIPHIPGQPHQDQPEPSQVFANTFPTEPWMCRNQTLLRAIEDLATNITLSYLSSSDLTDTNTTFKTIETSNTQNHYLYRPLYLVLPYGIALLFASITAVIGLYSIRLNGVSHSMNFSAILATTRNLELDTLTRGASLGTEPLKKDISEVKLRFGPLLSSTGISSEHLEPEHRENAPHIAFGYEKTVGRLRKRGAYV